ncbi:MAG: Uma2 family endonuclease [Myxococcales bacterium]|nr:Uma2 family endonuclease [Myxococcales bacterium]
MTIEEYLAFEHAAEVRHEFINGEAYAMSGGTSEHAVISTNILGALFVRLRGRRCRPINSDQRVFVPATEAFFYPDISVVCGGFEHADRDPNGIVNPKVIVEVLSPSTSGHDLGIKFQHYRRLATLEAYVLVHAEDRRIEHRQRLDDGSWLIREVTEGDLALPALDIAIPLDEIYDLTDVRPG